VTVAFVLCRDTCACIEVSPSQHLGPVPLAPVLQHPPPVLRPSPSSRFRPWLVTFHACLPKFFLLRPWWSSSAGSISFRSLAFTFHPGSPLSRVPTKKRSSHPVHCKDASVLPSFSDVHVLNTPFFLPRLCRGFLLCMFSSGV